MKTLTIVIPTYNRCKYVKENLENIISQQLEYQNEVDILIVDNASTDGTDKMITDFKKKYPHIIRYYRHNENIGASGNFDFGVKISDSKYVYLLGDDDLISPHFVKIVVDIISQNPDVGLIHFNYLMGTSNIDKVSLLYTAAKNRNLLTRYQSGKDFIPEFFNGPSFISSNIFLKDLWIKGFPYLKNDCPGYEWFSILLYGSLFYPCIFYYIPIAIQRFSGVNDYSKKWPLYSLIGMSKLFMYLDIEVPSLYDKWIYKRLHNDWVNFYLDLGMTFLDREYYKKIYKDFKPFIGGKVNAMILYCCIFIFPSWFTKYIYINCVKVLGKIF